MQKTSSNKDIQETFKSSITNKGFLKLDFCRLRINFKSNSINNSKMKCLNTRKVVVFYKTSHDLLLIYQTN